MKKAVILHSVSDAKHCVKNNLYKGNMLFSTHSSVDVYLKEKHALNCQCLSKFMSTKEILDQKKLCSDTVDATLRNLDYKLSPILNNKFGIKLNYFVPLYSYMGKYHYLGYSCFINCIKKISGALEIDKIYFYDYRPNAFLNTSTKMDDMVSCFFEGLETEVIKVPKERMDLIALSIKIFNRLKRAFLLEPKAIIDAIKIRMRMRDLRNNDFFDNKKSILLTMPLCELGFLKKHLKRYNIFNPRLKGRFTPSGLDANLIDIDLVKETGNPIEKLFLKDISEDFFNNIGNYLTAVNSVKETNSRHAIKLGIWGLPPNWKAESLVYEYLRSENIKILGAQHGCVYGIAFEPWHFDSDFKRCDYYISYGFTKEDLKRLYPDKNSSCEILPLGRIKFVKPESRAKKIDILFPITNSISMLEGGMARIPPHELTERQLAILEYLNSLKGFDIYVKPLANSNINNCAALSSFKRFGNIRLVTHMTLSEFLVRHSPKAVLIEYPSQSLFDVIHLDTEIFLMGDKVIPYEEEALNELIKRVHYCENADEAIAKLDLFLNGKLQKKRDDIFYNHYVYKKDAEKNVLCFAERLVNS